MLDKIGSWIENNREKVTNHINGLLLPNEKVIVWTFGHTAPPERMDRFPIIDSYYKLNKKNHYLILTDQRFIVLQVKGWSIEITNKQEWNRMDIASIKHLGHNLSDSIEITLKNGEKTIYRETEKDEAIGMEHSFKN